MATGDVTLLYSATTSGVPLTITVNGLTQTGGRESTAIINSTNKYLDAQLLVKLTTLTGTHASDLACYCHFYASIDGTNYSDPVTGTDAAITISTGMNLIGPVAINFGTSLTGLATRLLVVPSVANIFGGALPPYWGVVIENKTNITLSSTGTDNLITYIGIKENVSA